MLRHSEQLHELAKALAAAQGVMEGATKDKLNPHFKSKYADLGSVWDAIRQPLAKNGLSVVQLPFTDTDGRVHVSTMLMHQSGQWIEASYYVLPTKNDAQGIGSVLTYLKRYALTGIGVAPEDDDGEAAVRTVTNGNGQHATNGNGNGHAKHVEPLKRPVAGKPEEEAKKYVAKSEAELEGFTRIEDLRKWDDKNRDWLTRLHAIDQDLHANLTEVIAHTYRRLNTLGVG